MAELASAGGVLDNPGQAGGSLLAPLTNPAGGPPLDRAKNFLSQSPIKKALPWFAGVATLGAGALAWSTLAPAPQRVLYTQLDDGERASVVAALDKGNIHYKINSDTGALTVDEPDVYKARMLVAQNGSLALPDAGSSDGLDKLPMGASRAMENERLRGATEHELMLSIKEIDGVQAVRVHLAEGEKSVFVRDTIAPTASVMLRLADGRQLSEPQVRAIVNLVAGSVPGLTPDAVKVVDQHGRLLTDKASGDDDRLEMQARMAGALANLVARHPGGTVVAVSHADPIKAVVAQAAGTPLDLFQRLTVAPCSVSAIAYTPAGPVVLTVNSTASLDALAIA